MKISVVGLRGFSGVQGGIETHCENLYARLAKTDLNITVYGREKYRVRDSSDVKTVWLPCLHNQYLETISYMVFAFFHILFNKPNIVHIHGIGPALFAPLFKLIGCKVILTHHGADYKRGKWGFFAKKVLKIGEKIGIKYANRIIVLNECNKNSLCNIYAEKITVIPNGVELPQRKNKGQGKFILALGRFVKEKGFNDLLNALPKTTRCIIAGRADHNSKYSENLAKKANELGVELPGFVQGEAKEKLFLECSLFVIPSHHEGLPFTLLEAMSYGCRILASDIPVHKEVGLPEECYFPCRNVKRLADCLNSNLQDSGTYSTPNYDDILKEKYNWDKISQKTREVYDAL
ncbi:MAG: glycosyltransferase family 4 protein [Fibromonadaceae bacterium]|jgi:glycosyltransferase involved in cell wall biosynthesis|nr:glycosyltransferase family 4 protein [Fibromonadaceae bacterium]